MVISRKPVEEDLDIITYWINNKRRPWPVDEENNPIDDTGQPLALDADGLPVVEGEDAPESPERIRFWIQMLLGEDQNAIQSAMIKTKTARRRGKRGGRVRSEVESEIDIGSGVNMKLEKAIVKWEGITDPDGNPANITVENIAILPAWLQSNLADIVTDMSALNEEEAGE